MFSILALALLVPHGIASSCDTIYHGYQCDTSISHQWGNYAPYFSVPSTISNAIPSGCNISFVNLLSRHGARFPTSSNTGDYVELIQQIHNSTTQYSEEYAFIKDYNYTLGANDLTVFGQIELMYSGIKFYNRYKSLTKTITPFFRSSSDGRVVESAQNFSQGFHQARGSPDPTYPYPLLIISEDPGSNNTLNVDTCTNYVNGSYTKLNNNARDAWRDEWIDPVKDRVNDNVEGANLSKSQIIYLMDLCPFNTIANVNGTISQFCNLFNQTEWTYYNYYRTLDKWYEDLQGNPLGPTQGVGFAAELIARMTANRTYVTDAASYTAINHTLDNSQSTFPLGASYPLYADFSHDDDIASVYAALGLYNRTGMLSTSNYTTAAQAKGYSAAWTTPFGSRAYFEKMVCSNQPEELVRVVINDRVVPLQNCGADKLGRCTLSNFIASQTFVTSGGLWSQCFT